MLKFTTQLLGGRRWRAASIIVVFGLALTPVSARADEASEWLSRSFAKESQASGEGSAREYRRSARSRYPRGMSRLGGPTHKQAAQSMRYRKRALAQGPTMIDRAERRALAGRHKVRNRRPLASEIRTASLGDMTIPKPAPPRNSFGAAGLKWRASAGCLPSVLKTALASIASAFGSVTVNSTCRSHSHNARVGGARKSYHLTGQAADFRVHGNWRGAQAFLHRRGGVGGIKHYGGGLFHIDTGPRRSW